MLPKINFTTTKAYQYLADHYININQTDIKALFAEDPDRFNKFSVLFEDILFDYSKNRINDAKTDAGRADFRGRSSRWSMTQCRSNTGACSAISATTQSMNTRSLALTWRFGGKARYIGIGFICQSSNRRTSSPLARCPCF